MSTTTKKEGSYVLSILEGLAAGACMLVTALMVRQLGASLGATDDGRQLLSWGSIAVHLIGLVLMGLAFGYFEGKRDAKGKRINPGWSAITLALMVLSGGYTMAAIYGFVASERMTKQAAIEQKMKDEADAKSDQRAAAKQRLDAQIDMTKGVVDWAKKSVKTDDLGRRERKDMLEAAQKAISDVTKQQDAPARDPSAGKEILMRPDAQAEGLAKVLNLPISVVQNTLGVWFAFLLIALEMVLWPAASRTWPRRVQVEALIEAKPEAAPLVAGREAGTALQPVPEPKALPAPTTEQIQVVRDPAFTIVGTGSQEPPQARIPVPKMVIPLEPKTVAIPDPLILLPGADRWLVEMRVPLLAPRPGPALDWESHDHAGKCFACWLRAYNLLGAYSANQIEDLWARCCDAYHRKPIPWVNFKAHFAKQRSVEWRKVRTTEADSPKAVRWSISSAEKDIKKFAKDSDPKQEASPDTGPRPLARASVSLPEGAANDNRRKVAPAWLELQALETRQQKFMSQQHSMRSRKQRGNRLGRMGRAA